jgi:hypothetical protein
VRDVEERAGSGNDDTVLAKLLDSQLNLLDGSLEVGLPDVTAVNDTSREGLVGAKSSDDGVKLLRVTDKVNVNGVEALERRKDIDVVDNVTEVGGQGHTGSLVTESTELLVSGLEGSLGLGSKVEDEDRLVNLDILGTSFLELGKELNVQGEKFLEVGDGVNSLVTVGLGEGQERDRSQDDGTGGDASLLSLEELNDRLGVLSELVFLGVLEGGLDVVVVGVKPLDHFQAGNINGVLAILGGLLETTTHGEVLVNGVEVVLAVSLGNNTEKLDVVEDLVVESEIIAGDHIDTSVLLDLPVLLTESLSFSQKLIAGDLVTPVSLGGLLEVTESSHTGETQNSGLNHSD